MVDLIANGEPAGHVYGLCGLKILDSARLEADVSLVSRWDDRPVALAHGCSLSLTVPRKVLRGGAFGNLCDLWKEAVRDTP
jgi:hypothetical protein